MSLPLTNHPQNKRVLAEKMGTTPREVELAVNALRLEGWPICSDADGYWLGNAAEVRVCAERLRGRLRSQYLTVRAMRRTAQRMEAAQMAMPWAA